MINKPKPSTAGPSTTRWDPQAYLQFARLRERPVLSLERYYRLLSPLTTGLDIWETEHLQVVEGQSSIFDWVKVSALRPVLLALNEQERRRFLEQYLARVHQRYPPERDGHTLFPFKRIFILATV